MGFKRSWVQIPPARYFGAADRKRQRLFSFHGGIQQDAALTHQFEPVEELAGCGLVIGHQWRLDDLRQQRRELAGGALLVVRQPGEPRGEAGKDNVVGLIPERFLRKDFRIPMRGKSCEWPVQRMALTEVACIHGAEFFEAARY